ncbi:MAG TPA: hypothetical protein VJS43_19245 [Candidatus Acidoferrales bacterium]|nr:hypothetical protein [Candidatus Acidoferrales bacterium]
MNPATKGFAASATMFIALGLFAARVHAAPQSNADVSGTWSLQVSPAPPAVVPGATTQPEGPSEARGGRGPATSPTLTLKQDGNSITGTLAGGRGPGLAVTGAISGNSVTWTLSRRLADGIARPEVYKGTVNGDTITGSVAEPTVDPTQQYSVDFTAKRTH